jgi:putative hydrolase of HD superfamily
MSTDYDGIADFIYELGAMKKLKHIGTKYAGIKDPDTLAEHVFRTAQIGFILADLEGADTAEVMKICLFHDNGEIRVGDHTRIADQYFDAGDAEEKAFEDQLMRLPSQVREKLTGLVAQYSSKDKPKAFLVARDADLLETLFQAKEYLDCGYPLQRWIDNGEKYLKTKSAKMILKSMNNKSFTDWWDNLNVV